MRGGGYLYEEVSFTFFGDGGAWGWRLEGGDLSMDLDARQFAV